MKPKLIKLIRILSEQSAPITAASLAASMNVSSRSIKSYIQEINSDHPGAVESSREGYKLHPGTAKIILEASGTHVPQSSRERAVYIINSLTKNTHAINAFDLCDELFISYSTLKNELQSVRKKLAKFDLQLTSNKDKLTIHGMEKNKRKLLSSILYDESNVNFVSLKSIQNIFSDINIEFIKENILEIFDKYHCFVNDYSLINLILHIAIAIDRIRNHNTNVQQINEFPAVRSHEYELAKKVAERMEAHFKINYSDAEVYELTLLLISRATTIDYKSITAANLEDFIGKDCFLLVNELIQSVSNYYYIDLTEPEFLIRFALHICNLLQRSKNNYFSKNPLTEEIKTSCPLIYEVSVCLSGIIKERTNITINDDEIAYIAFHLGSTLEAQKSLSEKVTAILYCPNYYDMNTRLTDTINQQFSSDMLITNIMTDEQEFEKELKGDLLITTVPLNSIWEAEMIQINLFFTDKDVSRIRKKLEKIKICKKRNLFRENLEYLIIPKFFSKRNDIHNEKEAIEQMVHTMTELGYVESSFKNDIYAREKLSSTAFQDFAIPHALRMCANKTGINVLISDAPISWNEKPVHLVMMLCFHINERYLFNEVFEPLTLILSNRENIKKICGAKTYREFIELLVASIEFS